MRGLIIALLPFLLLVGCEREKHRLDEEVRRLCAKDGGVKVYETVNLPPDKFDRYGNVKIPDIEKAKESDKYYYVSEMVYLYGGKTSQDYEARIWRNHYKIIRRSDNKVLGEYVSYTRRGDGFQTPWHPSSFSCSDISKYPEFEKAIFLKENDK